mgnify:CR=1 FL=1
MEYLLGIDIGGTHVKGGIVTGTTGKMDQRTIVYEKIDAGGSATSIIKGILRVITALKKGRSENEWRGIGIAIPGPFDYTRGIAAIHGVRKFDALFGLDLKEEIKRVCSLPVVFLNDASAYALGEYYGGAAQGSERVWSLRSGPDWEVRLWPGKKYWTKRRPPFRNTDICIIFLFGIVLRTTIFLPAGL